MDQGQLLRRVLPGNSSRDAPNSLADAAGPMLTSDRYQAGIALPSQRSFADVEYDGAKRQTRRARFLQRMETLIQ